MNDQRWFYAQGSLKQGEWESVVDSRTPGWCHTGLHVAHIATGETLALPPNGVERIVVPLSGSFRVSYRAGEEESATVDLSGRTSVFGGPTDVLYLSCDSAATLSGAGRVAVASSPTGIRRPSRHVRAAETPIEKRGAGSASRQVHNFGTPDSLDAARLIVCEVITPAGNWSSYPPHKHDETVPGVESSLEEIYYFESAPASADGNAEHAFGLFSTYSSPAGDIDINAMVRSGDIALVPYGYHGPAVAAPGYHLYYLNVMAGPDAERAWRITDDPAHAWVRDDWPTQPMDPRLPFLREDTRR